MFKQIAVFLENKPGRIADVTGCLAAHRINLHALSIADTTDFGILRMVVSNPENTVRVLKENGFMVKTADVVALAVEHTSGSLHKVLLELKALDISIEYMYAFTSRHKAYDAIVILRLSDPEAALEKLKGSGFPLLSETILEQMGEP